MVIHLFLLRLRWLIWNSNDSRTGLNFVALHWYPTLVFQLLRLIISQKYDTFWGPWRINTYHELRKANQLIRDTFDIDVKLDSRKNFHQTSRVYGTWLFKEAGAGLVFHALSPMESYNFCLLCICQYFTWRAEPLKLNSSLQSSFCKFVFTLNTVLPAFIKLIVCFIEIFASDIECQGTTLGFEGNILSLHPSMKDVSSNSSIARFLKIQN